MPVAQMQKYPTIQINFRKEVDGSQHSQLFLKQWKISMLFMYVYGFNLLKSVKEEYLKE